MWRKVHVAVDDIVAFLEDRVLDARRGHVLHVSGVATLVPGAEGALSFAGLRSTAQDLSNSSSSLLLVHPGISLPASTGEECLLVVANPRLEFARVAAQFFRRKPAPGVASSATVDSTARVGTNTTIEAGAYVGPGVVIGESCVIGPNCVLLEGTAVGDSTSIGPNSTIGYVGFGYERELDGEPVALPHVGGVTIGSYVEIGANTCIDRGTIDDTTVEDFVKIDNLVHIAHNCRIQQGAFVIATAILCGGVQVGPRAWIAPNASVREQLSVGADAQVGLGSCVVRDVPPGATVVGSPAREIQR